jgi:Uma2 family endonuclease
MSVQDRGKKLTYDDLVKMPDDGKRHEIIDGKHYVSPSPRLRHQVVAGRLYGGLFTFLESHPLGHLFIGPTDILLSLHDVVAPDLVFVAREHEAILTEANVQGPPDLIVEVLSPSTRRVDELRKWRLYERAGVREYWIVDAKENRIKIYRQAGSGFGPASELSLAAADTLTTPILPGLSLPLDKIFPPAAGAPPGLG